VRDSARSKKRELIGADRVSPKQGDSRSLQSQHTVSLCAGPSDSLCIARECVNRPGDGRGAAPCAATPISAPKTVLRIFFAMKNAECISQKPGALANGEGALTYGEGALALLKGLAVLGHDDHRVDDDDVPVPKKHSSGGEQAWKAEVEREKGWSISCRASSAWPLHLHPGPKPLLDTSSFGTAEVSSALRARVGSGSYAPAGASRTLATVVFGHICGEREGMGAEVMHPPGPRGHWQRSSLGTSAGREGAWGRQDSIRPAPPTNSRSVWRLGAEAAHPTGSGKRCLPLRTCSMCWPHPAQEGLLHFEPARDMVHRRRQKE